ncbi:tetratricopeptide repeat protein [Puniceicoccaceae bacterium K14]|nr:tetratricopeptide repeat protein [Puniceicoccaceae bacterium K14]
MSTVPASSLDPRDQKQFSNAIAAIDRGNFEYAVDICIRLLEKTPSCLEVRSILRDAQCRIFDKEGAFIANLFKKAVSSAISAWGRLKVKKQPDKAMILGEKALSFYPYSTVALSLVAHGARSVSLNETEAFCLQSICDRFPDNVTKLERLCKALIEIGQTDDALVVAEKLISLRPGNTDVQELVKSASVAHSINRGKWAEKEKDFRSKLKDKDETEALENSNKSFEDMGSESIRTQDLIEQVHGDPQNVDHYKNLVKALIAKEDYDNALSWLNKAFKLPRAEADLYLRQVRSDLHLKKTERELFILQNDPSIEESEKTERIQRLDGKLASLRLEEAKKLVDHFPNDYGQRFKYGELLLRSGDIENAIQQFQISQRSPSLKSRSHVFLGRCFMGKGLFDLALEQLKVAEEAAVVMDSFKKDVLYLIASCYESLGSPSDAINNYKLIYASDIKFKDVASKIDAFYAQEK